MLQNAIQINSTLITTRKSPFSCIFGIISALISIEAPIEAMEPIEKMKLAIQPQHQLYECGDL